jgi:outer membrane protein OmpU
MKKILLGTTTLIGAATLFAGGAFAAETPKVTLGGFADFQVGFVSEDNDADERSGAFRSDTEVTLRIDGKTDGGLGYGGGIDLEADVEDDVDGQGTNASRTFVYLEGAWGRLQGGSDLGVTNTMKVDASRIARATGGIDGDFRYFGIQSATAQTVIATPDLILDHGGVGGAFLSTEASENINKLSYYTPRFAGFQAGVSYLFDTTAGDRGQVLSRADNTAGEAENVLIGALNWEGKWNDFAISLGATGEMGDAEAVATEDLRTWQIGAMVKWMGFSVAGSYGDWSDSLRAVGGGLDDSNFWTLGAAYEMGAFGASVTYLDSQYDVGASEDEFTNVSVGVDYKMAPGFTPYAEVSFFEIDGEGALAADENDGTVFIAGTQLAF